MSAECCDASFILDDRVRRRHNCSCPWDRVPRARQSTECEDLAVDAVARDRRRHAWDARRICWFQKCVTPPVSVSVDSDKLLNLITLNRKRANLGTHCWQDGVCARKCVPFPRSRPNSECHPGIGVTALHGLDDQRAGLKTAIARASAIESESLTTKLSRRVPRVPVSHGRSCHNCDQNDRHHFARGHEMSGFPEFNES